MTQGGSPAPRVLIMHPGKQHVYETVLAAQEAGMLDQFVTSYFWGSSDLFSRVLRRVSHGTPLERYLRRRSHPAIDPSLVRSFPSYHLAAKAADVVLQAVGRRSLPNGIAWASARFDGLVGGWLRSRPGVSVVHGFEGGALRTLLTARELGALTVLDVPSAHEYYVKEVNQERSRHGLAAKDYPIPYWVAHERSAADLLLAPSAYVARCLVQHGIPSARVVILPYGADAESFSPRPRPPGNRFRVLFVGRVGFRKGIEYLLEAWRRASLPKSELVIVGGVDDEIRWLLGRLPQNVRLLGNVPFPALHSLYQSSDVFVLPSLSEGSALAVYEAMAAGLPAIVTPHCGAVARDRLDGHVVPVRDADAIASSLHRLYNHPNDRIQMGASGRRLIMEKFTWKHYRLRLQEVYRALGSGHPIPRTGVFQAS